MGPRLVVALTSLAFCVSCAGRAERSFESSAAGNGGSGAGLGASGGVAGGGMSAAGGMTGPAGTSATAGAGPSNEGTRQPCYRSVFPPANPGRDAAGAGGSLPEANCSDTAQFCDFDDDACGRVTPQGVCSVRDACRTDDGPVCGCDGVTYANSCAAHAVGIDVDGQGLCQLQGRYICGPTPCALDSEACSGYVDHIRGAVRASCVSVNAECRAALLSGEDRFCECVTEGRCQCQVLTLGAGTAVFKTCSDR